MLKWRAYSAAGGRAMLWISIWFFNGVAVNIPAPVGISHNNYISGRLDYLQPEEVKCSVWKPLVYLFYYYPNLVWLFVSEVV